MEKEKQVVSRLVKGKLEMITACFDEYYFNIPERVIKPYPMNAKVFQVGEDVPVKGDTFEFPDDFDIVDLHFSLAASIRNKKLQDILSIGEYCYKGYPALNMMGFSIKIKSQEDFEEFAAHYKTFTLTERNKLAEFANRWFEITKFRNIKYL